MLLALRHEVAELVLLRRELDQRARRAHGVVARVDEDHDLLAAPQRRDRLVVGDLQHEGVALLELVLGDAAEGLHERHRPVGGAEEEEARRWVRLEEEGDVAVVGQRRREADDPDHHLRRLDEAQRARDERLDDGAAVVVEQVHLVDDEQADGGDEGVGALARRHVPLLGRRHDEVRLAELALRQLHVARVLLDLEPEPRQRLGELADDLLREGLHRRDVDHLQPLGLEDAVLVAALADLLHDRQQRDVRLAGAGRRAHEHVLVGVERGARHRRLQLVEALHALERELRVVGQLADLHEPLLRARGPRGRRHADLLPPLVVLAHRAVGQRLLLAADARGRTDRCEHWVGRRGGRGLARLSSAVAASRPPSAAGTSPPSARRGCAARRAPRDASPGLACRVLAPLLLTLLLRSTSC